MQKPPEETTIPLAKRVGRPALPPEQGKRYAVGIRTTKEIKQLLQRAADSAGRSVAAEIELRLERSFDPIVSSEDIREGLILLWLKRKGGLTALTRYIAAEELERVHVETAA